MTGKPSSSHKKNWGAQIEHGVARKDHLGNTNTPQDLAEALVRLTVGEELDRQVTDPGQWLEPAVGTGNFYLALLDAAEQRGIPPLTMARRLDAVDIDPQAITALRKRLHDRYGWEADVLATLPIHALEGGLLHFQPAHSYRAIVTNPPYLSPKAWSNDPAERQRLLTQWQTIVPGLDPRADLFLYFFHWCHAHLEPHGVSVFLCSDGWLDADYGRSLRQEFMTGQTVLERVLAWPWKALFRDDTCPIVTVARRLGSPDAPRPSTQLYIDDGDPLKPQDGTLYSGPHPRHHIQTLTPHDLSQWLGEGEVNRRQRVVTSPDLHQPLTTALAQMQPTSVRLDALTDMTGFGWSLNDLERDGLLLAQPGATGRKDQASQVPDPADWRAGLPLFFQKQARVGKPVDYRQQRATADFQCRVKRGESDLAAKVRQHGTRVGGVWVGLAIDRFPLVFFAEVASATTPWVGVSKYLHLHPTFTLERMAGSNEITPSSDASALLAALLTSTPALLALEGRFKEGTRKTLRKGENGYAKETTRGALAALPVPDPRGWSATTVSAVLQAQTRRAQKSLHRMEVALSDPDWLAIDTAIFEAMGVDAKTAATWRRLALSLYWRRMRNVAEYGASLG